MRQKDLHMIFELPDEVNMEYKRMTVQDYYFDHIVHRLLQQLHKADEDVEDV